MRSNLARTPASVPAQRRIPAAAPHALELVVELAHDLRSPLSSILVLAEFLKSGQSGPLSAAQRRQLGLIHSAALALCTIASDVVELARGGGKLTDQAPRPFSVSETFEAVRHMVLPIAEEKDIEFRMVLPQTDRRDGWERAISRVLLNLSTNALKFTDAGFVEVSAVEVKGDASLLEFAVQDSGRGIDPAEMRTLFEPFRDREAQRGHRFSSSGLGLTICRKLVHAMGSTLRVETALGIGTRFSFVLAVPPSKGYIDQGTMDVTPSPQT
jgi:signal transduction histidine kinase